eukprot:CAMPEP_0176269720 /NCGR_PEP_ID=MMETSP0121_2-20121125/44333_1 /TAXON_ID=160619 /ORGANISM="Kryptoperidinium foliaceum, Strain CCMP 1326" /LENGTH=95 /DNA_ID=CAMNT_0017609849 /DNA_START=73 /DNA_END=357 /DNA_ORIENTATION=+
MAEAIGDPSAPGKRGGRSTAPWATNSAMCTNAGGHRAGREARAAQRRPAGARSMASPCRDLQTQDACGAQRRLRKRLLCGRRAGRGHTGGRRRLL